MPRPRRLRTFDYTGFHRYFFTSCTYERRRWFENASHVDLLLSQILRTSHEDDIAVDAYCVMPDHLHALITGTSHAADAARFVRLVKQRSGVRFQRATGERLWQEGYYDRVLRDEEETAAVMAYIVNNPLRAGLARSPKEYPFWGSSTHRRDEILEFVAGASVWVPT